MRELKVGDYVRIKENNKMLDWYNNSTFIIIGFRHDTGETILNKVYWKNYNDIYTSALELDIIEIRKNTINKLLCSE